MNIALAQLNFHIGNFEENTSKIIRSVQQAEAENVDLVVFSELAITGYPPRDFLEFRDFVDKSLQAINKIATYCTRVTAIVGVPTYNSAAKGKPLFNSAAVLAKGKVQQFIHKSLLPNYDIFDEYRYFEPNRHFELVKIGNKKLR